MPFVRPKPSERLGEDGQRVIDHRVGRGQRDAEVAGQLDGGTGQDEHVPLREEFEEREVVGDGRARQQVEGALRRVDLIANRP